MADGFTARDVGPEVVPVVIIGAARSGTKFLRDTLAASGVAAAVPYDVNYVWRYGRESHPDDVLNPESVTAATERYIRRTLPRLAGIRSGDGTRILIEKTVSNALRPAFVERVLPEARFIHLVRDGRAVVESAMRMWRDPPDPRYMRAKLRQFPLSNYRYAFWYARNVVWGRLSGRGARVWGPRYPGMDRDAASEDLATVCSRQWKESVERSLDGMAAFPRERLIEVRYESLIRDPSELIRTCAFLGIPDQDAVLKQYHATLRPLGPNLWRSGLSDADRDTVLEIITPTLQRLGYVDDPGIPDRHIGPEGIADA